jgi:hypothetical protein
MNTQSHILMGAVLFGHNVPRRAWAGMFGGLIPDVPMLAIVLALKISGVPDQTIFGELYWQNWWQVTNAVAHSFILWGALLVFSLALRHKAPWWTLVAIFSASALIHTSIDFLVHREDAHMSFWPLTRWKFVSPVSYWDWRHYGRYFSVFEATLGLLMASLLFMRFRHMAARAALGLAMFTYVAVPAYFILL